MSLTFFLNFVQLALLNRISLYLKLPNYKKLSSIKALKLEFYILQHKIIILS